MDKKLSNKVEKFVINEITYEYNFAKLKASQLLLCQGFWELSEKQKAILPSNNDELFEIMSKRVAAKAWEYLIIEVDKNGNYLPSTLNNNRAVGILDEMDADDFKRLEECRDDFFTKQGIISQSSMENVKLLLGNENLMKLLSAQGLEGINL